MSQRIVIVGRRVWGPRLRADFTPLDAGQKDLAAAALRYMHDLHVGITPELAAGLARAMSADARQRAAAGPWALIFERLEDQLVPGDGKSRDARRPSRRRYNGMVPRAVPFYAVARIAAPLVAQATEKLDRVYLFAADPVPAPEDFTQRYRQYSTQLAYQLKVLASSDKLSEVFWTDRAFTLSQLSRSALAGGSVSAPAPSAADRGTPEVDAITLGQLLRLEPELSSSPALRRSLPRRLTTSPRYRPLLNRNEGGVDGIFQTRRQTDLPGMLKSELLHPPPLLLERLLRTGYLALRRPPMREKQRDVMVAGILPPTPPPSPVSMKSSLVKAAWFDAMVRLSVWLARAGLKRSELLWIEADECGRSRDSRCLLEDLPDTLRMPQEPTPAYRKEFLGHLGWMPGYLDRHASGRWPSPGADGSDALDWAMSAWRSQRDHLHWQPRTDPHSGRGVAHLDHEAYDTIHLMLFLPRKVEKTRGAGVYRHAFGLPPEPGYSVSVTWMPDVLTDVGAETGWAVSVEGKPVRPVLRQASDENGRESGFENRLAGALLDTWLKTILQELVRDS